MFACSYVTEVPLLFVAMPSINYFNTWSIKPLIDFYFQVCAPAVFDLVLDIYINFPNLLFCSYQPNT